MCATVFTVVTTFAADESNYVEGEGKLQTFRGGATFEIWDLSYKLFIGNGRFGAKVLLVQPELEKRMFVASDYKAVYQSETLTNTSNLTAGQKASFATFEKGLMPSRVGLGGWWVPQSLVLSLHLLQSRVIIGNTLPDMLIPEFFRRRATEHGMNLGTQVVRKGGDGVTGVKFLAIRRNTSPSHNTDPANACLIGEIYIEGREAYLPTQIRSRNYNVVKGSRGTLEPILMSEFTVKGVARGNSVNISKSIAYDSDVSSYVNDTRFGAKSGYVLKPGDDLPFDGTPRAEMLAMEGAAKRTNVKSERIKRTTIIGLSAMSFALLCLFVMRQFTIGAIANCNST